MDLKKWNSLDCSRFPLAKMNDFPNFLIVKKMIEAILVIIEYTSNSDERVALHRLLKLAKKR